jgi:anti-anti-sigma factor
MTEIVVQVTQPLDGDAVETWSAELAAAADQRPARLIVDLTACPRIDAAAIVVLLRTHGRLLRAHGTLLLRHPSARIRRTLRLARVDQVLEVEDSGVLADAR